MNTGFNHHLSTSKWSHCFNATSKQLVQSWTQLFCHITNTVKTYGEDLVKHTFQREKIAEVPLLIVWISFGLICAPSSPITTYLISSFNHQVVSYELCHTGVQNAGLILNLEQFRIISSHHQPSQFFSRYSTPIRLCDNAAVRHHHVSFQVSQIMLPIYL